MMGNKKKYLIIIAFIGIITFFSLHTFNEKRKIDGNAIPNLKYFIQAKDIFIKNLDIIKNNIAFQEYDSVKQVKNEVIFSSNKHFFLNSINKSNNIELQKIENLWQDGLITNSFSDINLYSDSTIIFCVQEFKNSLPFMPMIRHYIIYSNNYTSSAFFDLQYAEILKEEKINNEFTYAIIKAHYD